MDFPGGASDKEYACKGRRCKRYRFSPWLRKIPWSRWWQPTPVFLPGKFYVQRRLVSYSPWVTKSQTWLSMHAWNSISKKQANLKDRQKTWIDIFPNKTHRWQTSTLKEYSTLLILTEMKIKTTVNCHHSPVRMATIKNCTISRCWQECGEERTPGIPLAIM